MKMSNIWFGWILIVGLIVISGVSATPGDTCTTHSHCEAGEYCYGAGEACSQCYNNNACAIYGNSIDGDCSKCSTSSSSDPAPSSNDPPPPPHASSGVSADSKLQITTLILVSLVHLIL